MTRDCTKYIMLYVIDFEKNSNLVFFYHFVTAGNTHEFTKLSDVLF